MRELVKDLLNGFAKLFGARLVGAAWGPRGFATCFTRAKALGFEPTTVIDVGASNGCWTRECITVFPQSRYCLFDPLPANVSALVALTSRYPRVSFWSGALGAEPGRSPLNVHGDQTSFYPSTDFAGHQFEVEIRPLDSFIESMNIQAPLIIKADVQGYELEVLRGAQRCVRMTELLLLEVSFRQVYDGSPLAHQVIAEIGALGFRIYDICSYVQRPRDMELTHADLVFAREKSRVFQTEGWN